MVKWSICRHQDHLRRQSIPALILTDDIIVENPSVERAPNQPRQNPPRNVLTVTQPDLDMITEINAYRN